MVLTKNTARHRTRSVQIAGAGAGIECGTRFKIGEEFECPGSFVVAA
jgi:hypothetical protein